LILCDKLTVPTQTFDHFLVMYRSEFSTLEPVTANGQFLAMLDHAPGAIIVDHANNRNLVPQHRFEFHGIKTEGTIAVEKQNFPVRMRQFGSHGKRYAGPKTAQKPRRRPHNASPVFGHESRKA